MPNRIIKESIWTSPNLNRLSLEAEYYFYRLLPLPDDHGCFEATPLVVLGKCFPYRINIVTVEKLEAWNQELQDNEIVRFWRGNDGRLYGKFLSWELHQRIRATHARRTPVPPWEDNGSPPESLVSNSPSFDDKRSHSLSGDGLNPNLNPNHNPFISQPDGCKTCPEKFRKKCRTKKEYPIDQCMTLEAKEVVAYLNEVAGKEFHTGKHTSLEHPRARLREGYSMVQCKQVIDIKLEDEFFIENPRFLDPKTLFRPSNFERYLNEKPKKPIKRPPGSTGYKEL